MTRRWTLDSVPWNDFRPDLADPQTVSLIKAAALVEHNSASYGRYLQAVFPNDPDIHRDIDQWVVEEEQHGKALARWAALADPEYDHQDMLERFAEKIKLPETPDGSVRGSRQGEMVARCVVEVGTSSFYSALRDNAKEPVLKYICKQIAADEFRHYSLFKKHAARYAEGDGLSTWGKVKIALGRIIETGDDELAYALYCGTGFCGKYSRKIYGDTYGAWAAGPYEKKHTDRAVGMIARATGLNPDGALAGFMKRLSWTMMFKRKSGGRLRHRGLHVA